MELLTAPNLVTVTPIWGLEMPGFEPGSISPLSSSLFTTILNLVFTPANPKNGAGIFKDWQTGRCQPAYPSRLYDTVQSLSASGNDGVDLYTRSRTSLTQGQARARPRRDKGSRHPSQRSPLP